MSECNRSSKSDDEYPGYSPREYHLRNQLHDRATGTKNFLYITYKRMYVAAEWVGRFGWTLDLFTAIIGSILLYILTREGQPGFFLLNWFYGFEPADFAIVILISSLLSSFYGPKLRSRDYYNAGQELQELHDEFTDFVDMDLVDPGTDITDLRQRFEDLNHRRHRLNQSTPQLGGYWYRLMKLKENYKKIVPWESYSEWEEPSFDSKLREFRRSANGTSESSVE